MSKANEVGALEGTTASLNARAQPALQSELENVPHFANVLSRRDPQFLREVPSKYYKKYRVSVPIREIRGNICPTDCTDLHGTKEFFYITT